MTTSPICWPRYSTPRTTSRRTRGDELARIAKALGVPLMPWQQLVADVGLEILDDGRPAYREVVVTVPRQNGKTTLVLSWQLHRALLWGGRQSVFYGAADGNAARKKLIDDQLPILRSSPLSSALANVRLAAGSEALVLKNESRIEVMGSSQSAGHGRTIDLAIADEVWSDLDDRREQALIPAMSTRKDAQLLVVSTAGHAESVYLRRKVDAGRAAVLEGRNTAIAYFEWSADTDAAIDDPATWAACMPALGHTISEDAVAHALASMTEDEFRRAYLNQWTEAHERVIPQAAWEAICADVAPTSGLAFGVDINPERSFSSIAVVDSSGIGELGNYGAGTAWVVDRTVELAKRHRAPVAVDTAGPAGTLIPELENAGVTVIKVGGRDFAHACASLYDAVADQKIRVRDAQPMFEPLDHAVAVACRRPLGDAWAFARRNTSSDISPLVALTLAHWAQTVAAPAPEYRIVSLAP